MTDHDAIAARVRQDREAGTPGVWDAAIESGCHAIVAAILPDGANIIALIGNSLETPERETMRFANARRIAALPDLEAAYLDLYDEVQRLLAALDAGKRTVPAGQTPLDDKLNHRFLDVIREGEAARDAGTASPYHGHSLEHCLHATGWVSRDLRLALDEARARAEKAEAERDALRVALVEHNDLLRSAIQIAKREGIDGQIASTNWDAYYNRVSVILKRHHAISNTARAALKGDSYE